MFAQFSRLCRPLSLIFLFRQYKLNVEGDVPCYCRFSPDGHYLLVGLGDSTSFWVYKIFSQVSLLILFREKECTIHHCITIA